MASGAVSANELASKNNMFQQLMVKGDQQENVVEENGAVTASSKVLREMVPGSEGIQEENSGDGEPLIKIGSHVDMGMVDESKDQLKSSLRGKSKGKVSYKGSE
jgi:hypothetical protein